MVTALGKTVLTEGQQLLYGWVLLLALNSSRLWTSKFKACKKTKVRREKKPLIWLLVFIYPFNSANLGRSTTRSHRTNITNHQFGFRFIYLKNPDTSLNTETQHANGEWGSLQSSTLLWQKKGGMNVQNVLKTHYSTNHVQYGENRWRGEFEIWRTWIITWILQVKPTRAESQLNLALEKSISGCWAMNLQTHKSHKHDNMSPKQEQVRLLCLIIFQTPF